MRHQVNANIVHRWLREHESQGLYSESAFLPVTLQLESESSSLTSSSSVDSAPIFSQREPPTIRVEAVWLATEPMDMRAGTDTAFARVIKVFGGAHPHRAAVAPGSVGFRIVIGQSKGESLAPTSVFPIATAPVLKRLGRRDAVNQRIGDGNDAHGVVSKARLTISKKYVDRNLLIAFPNWSSESRQDWYLLPHDELVRILGADKLETKDSWSSGGLSKKQKEALGAHMIGSIDLHG